MIIEVTQEDIDNGVPKDHCNCMVARAVRRQGFPDATAHCGCTETGTPPMVCKSTSIDAPDWPLSRDVGRKMRAFDAGKKVKPFRFRLRTS